MALNKLYVHPSVKEGTLAYKFAEAINKLNDDRLTFNYVCLLTTRGLIDVRVDAVYSDGYESEGIFYTFSPFTSVPQEDIENILKREQELLSADSESVN